MEFNMLFCFQVALFLYQLWLAKTIREEWLEAHVQVIEIIDLREKIQRYVNFCQYEGEI